MLLGRLYTCSFSLFNEAVSKSKLWHRYIDIGKERGKRMQLNDSLDGAEFFLRIRCFICHEIPRILCNPNAHYRSNKSQVLVRILSQMNSVRTVTLYCCTVQFSPPCPTLLLYNSVHTVPLYCRTIQSSLSCFTAVQFSPNCPTLLMYN
jgi:hypothetical protein